MKPTPRSRTPIRAAVAAAAGVCLLGLSHSVRAGDLTGSRTLWRATVQLGPIWLMPNADGSAKVLCLGWGSGTIVSPDGLILTNHHVADVSSFAAEAGLPPEARVLNGLVVAFTTSPDQPPVMTCFAEVVADRPDFDLALLQITSDLSGARLNTSQLDLPFVECGNSDEVMLEDAIRVYGYPGIGGSTVTFTKGTVSGFVGEEGIGARAWIKTDASISGGNSGGSALNDVGQLIGVPTLAGSGARVKRPVDCRPVQDTNGDGVLDDRDVCVPLGGFINALRPVNLANILLAGSQHAGGGLAGLPGSRPSRQGVQFVGTIVDAQTGRPIPNAVFCVLATGVSWSSFTRTASGVLGTARTDYNGRFALDELVEPGQSYSVGWAAEGYREATQDDARIPDDARDVLEVKLLLERQ
jgi:S1-C subfamily serine protease